MFSKKFSDDWQAAEQARKQRMSEKYTIVHTKCLKLFSRNTIFAVTCEARPEFWKLEGGEGGVTNASLKKHETRALHL